MIMGRLDNLASGLLRPMNPHGAILLGALTFVWGIWVGNPFWEVFTRAPVYHEALDLAPEWAWGTWASTVGIVLLLSLLSKNAKWLSRAALCSVWHWFTVSGMMWWGDWHNTAGVVYLFIGFYSLFVYLNTKVNFVKQGITHF